MRISSSTFSTLSRTRLAAPLPPISKRCFLTLAPSSSARELPTGSPNPTSPSASTATASTKPPLAPTRVAATTPPKPPASITLAPSVKPLSKGTPQYHFETNFSLFAKRAPRPFPPPFNSRPTSSFTDASSIRARIPTPEGAPFLRGITNGDDAILRHRTHLGVADGVGAWNTKAAGHAALWSRLMLHYFSLAQESTPEPVDALQKAYTATLAATSRRDNVWEGTTTACVAAVSGSVLTVANVGDSRAFVYRPSLREFTYKSTEQWHWFDCPFQLGTNSLDTPAANAVVDRVELEEGDVVILATDGLSDNLWDVEIAELCASHNVEREGEGGLADRLVRAAWKVAINPFGESPYMERGIDEGLSMEGGKFDDISVVTGIFSRSRK